MFVLAACEPPPAPLRADIRCEPEHGLRHRCTIRLAEGDRPLLGATVRVTADMPSMPLAHHVPPAACVPAGPPGSCVARVDFEMPGRWMLGLTIAGPRSDHLTHPVDVHLFESDASGTGRVATGPVRLAHLRFAPLRSLRGGWPDRGTIGRLSSTRQNSSDA